MPSRDSCQYPSPRRAVSRRDLLTLGIGAFVVAAVPAAARRRPRLVRRNLPVMGTIAEVIVAGAPEDRARAAIDAAMQALRDVEWRMSRFRAESEIGLANTSAARRPVVVSEATADVVRQALEWARVSGGAFDPAIGRVVELWDVTRRHEPPADAEVRRLAGRRLYRSVEVGLQRGAPAIAFGHDDVHLDLGGIAKGYAVDRAADALRAHGVAHALVNVGGDLVAMGHGGEGPWRVGIRSPDDPDGLLRTVEASDCAIATSGDYEQFFRYRGVKYHHLMDASTAAPARKAVHSVTVRAARCLDADAAATAAFGLDRERLAAVLAARRVELVHVV